MSSTKKIASKVFKPLNPTEFDSTNVKFSPVKNNTEIRSKWVDTTYEGCKDGKFYVTARGCVIKSFTKQQPNPKYNDKPSGDKPKKDKYTVWMGIKDTNFMNMIEKYDDFIISKSVENGLAWFGNEMTEEECRDLFKSVVSRHEKYGNSLSGVLSREFSWESKIEEVSNSTPLEEAFQKHSVVDVVLAFNSVKFATDKYNLGVEIVRMNLVGTGGEGSYVSNSLTLNEFQPGKITLTEKVAHEKSQGGRYCKVLYDERPLRIRLTEVEGRVFEFKKEDTTSYSISIRLNDKKLREMVESIDNEVLAILLENSEKYLDGKKKATAISILKKNGGYKNLCSFSKKDAELIKEKKEPANPPSLWIKIYYDTTKGFDNKIINADTGKPISTPAEIINKDVSISEIEVYSRHLWFGKTYSVNLTLNRASISYNAPVFDMGDDDGDSATGTEEAYNSDDE